MHDVMNNERNLVVDDKAYQSYVSPSLPPPSSPHTC